MLLGSDVYVASGVAEGSTVCVGDGVSLGVAVSTSVEVGVFVETSCVKVAVLSGVCVKVGVLLGTGVLLGVCNTVGVAVGLHCMPSACAAHVKIILITIRLITSSFFIHVPFLLPLKVGD